MGLILAMAGNAVGLGNFLRFPVQASSKWWWRIYHSLYNLLPRYGASIIMD